LGRKQNKYFYEIKKIKIILTVGFTCAANQARRFRSKTQLQAQPPQVQAVLGAPPASVDTATDQENAPDPRTAQRESSQTASVRTRVPPLQYQGTKGILAFDNEQRAGSVIGIHLLTVRTSILWDRRR